MEQIEQNHTRIYGGHMEELHFVDACTDKHFCAMSLIHAMGWRDTYADAVPTDYIASEITDDRCVSVFRSNYEMQNGVHGLLLYRKDKPVSCLNYCQARTVNYNPGDICTFDNANYANWGENASFYTHPAERGRGYGSLIMEEALRRLKLDGFQNVFVFVLRENEKARKFYASPRFYLGWLPRRNPLPPWHGLCRSEVRQTSVKKQPRNSFPGLLFIAQIPLSRIY